MNYESDSDSLDTTFERSDYPCQFCHNDFINQEEGIEHVEICSGTNTEREVWKPHVLIASKLVKQMTKVTSTLLFTNKGIIFYVKNYNFF